MYRLLEKQPNGKPYMQQTPRAELIKVDHLFSFFLYRAAAHAISSKL